MEKTLNNNSHFQPYVYVIRIDHKRTKFGMSCSMKGRLADYRQKNMFVQVMHLELCKNKSDAYKIEGEVKTVLRHFIVDGTYETTMLNAKFVSSIVKLETKKYYGS